MWAAWCGPCRMVGPIVDELAGDYAGRIKVGKLDVDAEPQIAAAFGVALDSHHRPAEGRSGRRARDRRAARGPATAQALRLDEFVPATSLHLRPARALHRPGRDGDRVEVGLELLEGDVDADGGA